MNRKNKSIIIGTGAILASATLFYEVFNAPLWSVAIISIWGGSAMTLFVLICMDKVIQIRSKP